MATGLSSFKHCEEVKLRPGERPRVYGTRPFHQRQSRQTLVLKPGEHLTYRFLHGTTSGKLGTVPLSAYVERAQGTIGTSGAVQPPFSVVFEWPSGQAEGAGEAAILLFTQKRGPSAKAAGPRRRSILRFLRYPSP